ncbi:MAG: alpha/beta hydrolase [Acidimicrobiia bacterium]
MADLSSRVDPEIASILARNPMGAADYTDLPAVRATRAAANAQLAAASAAAVEAAGVDVTDHYAPGDTPGAPDVLVRVYRPRSQTEALPALYWIHGGGFMVGSVDQDDVKMAKLAAAVDCVVASVDYRLAPEHPYPAPLDDCHAGLQWLLANTASLRVDRDRIAIGGGSAGGGLAAGLALRCRDTGVAFAYSLLVYPMLDDREITPSSSWEVPVWNPASNRVGWKAFLGDLYGTNAIPDWAAPARAQNLAGLPPTFIGVGSLDLFVHEDLEYAHRLLAAGVAVELVVYPNAPHGFNSLTPSARLAKRLELDIVTALRSAFGTY